MNAEELPCKPNIGLQCLLIVRKAAGVFPADLCVKKSEKEKIQSEHLLPGHAGPLEEDRGPAAGQDRQIGGDRCDNRLARQGAGAIQHEDGTTTGARLRESCSSPWSSTHSGGGMTR